MDGWIRLSKRLLYNTDIWDTENPFDYRSAWIDLLLMAEWQDHTILTSHGLQEMKRGCVYKSCQYLSARWKWDRKKVYQFLDMLQEKGMVVCERKPKIGTIIFLCNYKGFQDFSDAERTNDSTNDSTIDSTYLKKRKNKTISIADKIHNFEERNISYDDLFDKEAK